MTWTSPTTVNASQGLDSFIPYLSEVTQFWFGRMLVIAILLIFLFGYVRAKAGDFFGGLAVSSYVTLVISMFLWIIGLLTGMDLAWIVGLSLVSTLIVLVRNRD